MERVDGPGGSNAHEGLIHFKCEVGEGYPRVFRAYFDLHDKDNDVLYTDVEKEDERGGQSQETEIKITPYSTDAYSVRMWEMTAAVRAQMRTQLIADQNGEAIKEKDPTPEEVLAREEPIKEDGAVESKPAPDLQKSNPPLPTHDSVPTTPLPEPMYTEHDVQAECLNRVYRAAINDLFTYCQLEGIDNDVRLRLAEQKMMAIEELEIEYGLREMPRTDTDEL